MKDLIIKLLKQKTLTPDIIASFKRKWAKKTGLFPKNSQLLAEYKKLVKTKTIKPRKSLEKALRLKKIRSLSGIVPVAVLTKPYPCPGKCVYCPTQKGMPKSYLEDEPAVMRAKKLNFDPYLQVQKRIEQLKITGHATDKIELIVLGGTFSVLPKNYQLEFIINCFAACNKPTIKNYEFRIMNLEEKLKVLEKQQKLNETAKNRIIGLTLETRPDKINQKEIKWMRLLGATRVEIGAQSIFDEILKKVNRGHLTKDTIRATKLLKDAGFKVCYHLMPNLPGSNPKKDLAMFKTIFTDPRFKPDMVKIYPCMVCKQAELYDWYKKGKFQPYPDRELIKLLIEIKKIVPPWIRINRLGRDIPIANIAAGTKLSNIREIVQKELKKEAIKCRCIRCREIKDKSKIKNQKSKIIKYPASGGIEYFLQYIDKVNNLYALLRLRVPSQGVKAISPRRCYTQDTLEKGNNCGIIRELHTYGESLSLAKKDSQVIQHKGLGKKLLKKAEEITKSLGIKKITVIAGVGVRQYYRYLGYKLQNTYMVKAL